MLSLRSLAFILASAIRRSRALSCAALHRFPDRISGRKMRKMATKIPTKMLTKMAVASMSVPYEHFTPSRLGRDIPALSSPKIQSTQI
jgi:hypothetical protein